MKTTTTPQKPKLKKEQQKTTMFVARPAHTDTFPLAYYGFNGECSGIKKEPYSLSNYKREKNISESDWVA